MRNVVARYIPILYTVYQIFNNSAVSSKIKPQTFGKRKTAGNIRVIFLSSFEEITYLSYCIRDNPLKKKELCAETW